MDRKSYEYLGKRQKRRKLTLEVQRIISSFTENSSASELVVDIDDPSAPIPENTESPPRVSYNSEECPRSPECSSDSDDEEIQPHKFQDQIAHWVTENNVSQTSVSQLLKILRSHSCHSSLPKDARTLMKTPRTCEIINISPGQYVHFSLLDGIIRTLDTSSSVFSDLHLQISVDGIPISKSSSKQFWPILGFISGSGCQPFEIGIYCGDEKPKSVSDYLNIFLSDLRKVLEEWVLYKSQHIKVILEAFVCDAPARAFLKSVKCHGGYSACEKCNVYGEYYENRVVYVTDSTEVPRTDFSFRQQHDADHHTGTSPLLEIPINLVTVFPYEYMHLICLGVVRKLIFLWIKGKVSKFRLCGRDTDQLSERLQRIKPFVPSEFNCKPRPISEFCRWKATELRQFLLYTGPVVLREVLPIEHYSLFLCLHYAIRILISEALGKTHSYYAEELLQHFVKTFPILYGKEFLSYNVHGLLHIAEDARQFGSLDSFSAFRFENHLGKLKRFLKSGANSLVQIHNRLSEQRLYSKVQTVSDSKVEFHLPHSSGSLLHENQCPQFRVVTVKQFDLRIGERDGVVLLNNGAVVVIRNFATNLAGEVEIIGSTFKTQTSLYTVPNDSKTLCIYHVNEFTELKNWTLTSIDCKCFLIPSAHGGFGVMPLVHVD